jgi:hypothetical protein
MTIVFLSYSRDDHFFAELATIKLAEAKIHLWRDQGELRPGTDWRNAIEKGISDSAAVVVALSASSADSSYVTYEWAYALGKGKPVIPIKLADCLIHPKLETIQYLDFSVPGALPWGSLIERIREIETDDDSAAPAGVLESAPATDQVSDPRVNAILAYLNERGFQMASFERLRQVLGDDLRDDEFRELIKSNPTVLRTATLKGNKPGLAKRVP